MSRKKGKLTRKFDKKRFTFHGVRMTKRRANADKKRLKKKGHLVRVTKGHGYNRVRGRKVHYYEVWQR